VPRVPLKKDTPIRPGRQVTLMIEDHQNPELFLILLLVLHMLESRGPGNPSH
jgi:hypothetical protein